MFAQSDMVETGRTLFPGLLVCLTVAAAAQFLSNHYGAPQMLFALLLGLAFHFLAEEGRCVPGVEFSASLLLRFGVALLGLRITFEEIVGLGGDHVALVAAGVVLTIGFGIIAARVLRRHSRFGTLTGSAVAICGASAALAVTSVLPKSEHGERDTIFTVVAVTTFSTVAMIAYPILAAVLGLDDRAAGIFMGTTIHDVAQVIGAGYTISNEAGDIATVVKLFRVALLVPVVLVLAVVFRGQTHRGVGKLPFPLFIVGFCVCVGINSLGVLPAVIHEWLIDLSRWSLVTAIAALGVKTSLKTMTTVGYQAVALVLAETVFIAAFIIAGIEFLAR